MRSPRVIPEITPAIVARFCSFVRPVESGCHNWGGAKGQQGYGHFSIGQQIHRAHRVAYAIRYGVDPGVMQVCHSCDNPSCVNPDHLWLGTAKDNFDDMIAKGRRRCAVAGDSLASCIRCGHLRSDDYIDCNGLRRCRNCIKIRDARKIAARRQQKLEAA